MNETRDVVRASLRRCERLVAGVDELLPLLGPIMPLRVKDLAELSFEQRTASIAFLKRFEQLQDMLGRLCRAVISWEGGDAREMTQRDLADWMEKRELIETAGLWMNAVILRNRLVHEYPISEEEQVARVNLTWEMMAVLKKTACALNAMLRSEDLE